MRDIMLVIHFIGLAMFIGTGFAFLFLEVSNAKLKKEELLVFSLRLLPLSTMGKIGLVLLILSGGYLMTPYWQVLGNMPMLIAKLLAVVLVTIAIIVMAYYSKKAKTESTEHYLKKVEPYSKVSFILGFAIIVLAVFTFH